MEEFLSLDWKIGDEIVSERISEQTSREWNIYDYYFEARSVIAMSRYYYLCKNFYLLNTEREHLARLLKKIIEVNDTFLDVVSILLDDYINIKKNLGRGFQKDLEGAVKQYQEKRITRDQYEELNRKYYQKEIQAFFSIKGEIPSYRHEMNKLILNLVNNIEENYAIIIDKINETSRYIKNKIKGITYLASKIWLLGLFDFNGEVKEECFTSQKINKLLDEYENILRILEKGYHGKKAYNKENRGGCVAVCFTDDMKCFSLSGIDCDVSQNNMQGLSSIVEEDVKNMGKIIENKTGLTYCKLNKNTVRYVDCDSLDEVVFDYQETCLSKDYINKSYLEIKKNYTCCERKIVSSIPNRNNYVFFIKYLPCKKCLPAVKSTGSCSIKVYTRFNRLGFGMGHSQMIETEVFEISYLEKYRLIENYFVGNVYNCEN